MAAVDVVHRGNKPLPSPRLGPISGDIHRPARRAAPARTRKGPAEVFDDAPIAPEIDEADPAEPFSPVPHVAEQTLHAIHNAIFGQPFADLELVVAGAKKEEVVYANSKVLRKACPALMKQISLTGRAELDTMENVQVGAAKKEDQKTSKPLARGQSGNSLGLLDYSGRFSGVGRNDEREHGADDFFGDHADEAEEEYADSVAEQPKRYELRDDGDDGAQQDLDNFGMDDLDAGSPLDSRGKVAGGATPPAPAPIQIVAPPAFSRSSSRFSKLMKFMKDKASPSAEDAIEAPLASTTAAVTDCSNDVQTLGRGRVRRYSAANDLASPYAPRTPTASRVPVTGCSAATLQALIFYLYTGHATFASRLPSRRYASSTSSLDSEHSSDDEAGSIPEPRTTKSASYPPVFSATAAYCVGRQLGLRDLATKAFDQICLELSPKTVLADLLNLFVDRFDEVQRAHLEYVSENWDRVKRRPDFEMTVGRLVNGEYPKANKALLKLFAKLSVSGGRV